MEPDKKRPRATADITVKHVSELPKQPIEEKSCEVCDKYATLVALFKELLQDRDVIIKDKYLALAGLK